MRKTDRLDQVLLRLGHVTQADVDTAVARQQATGGRIGRNLVEMGALTEEQLFDGLVEQFRVPTISVDESSVPDRLLARMPKRPLHQNLIVPIEWNPVQGVLSLAVANPSDQGAIEEVRQAFGARKVRISLAPESLLERLVERLGGPTRRDSKPGGGVRLVALPELFEPELTSDEVGSETVRADIEAKRRVVVVSDAPVMKNFLPAVVAPEGCAMEVVSSSSALAEAMGREPADAVLVADALVERFDGWITSGVVDRPSCEVLRFQSVSASLLENPASYADLVTSVRAAVLAVSEYRCAAAGVSPPYALMAQDLEALSSEFQVGRLATDGLLLGLHLLMPVAAGTTIDPFLSFANSLEIAHRLRFPWPVEALLRDCLRLYVGADDGEPPAASDAEATLAAQMLALVWFRHNLVPAEPDRLAPPVTDLRLRLREAAGRLASLDLVEAYLRQLADRDGPDANLDDQRILLVGGAHMDGGVAPAFGRVGVRVEMAADMTDAQSSIRDGRPATIMLDHVTLGDDVKRWCRMLRVDRQALLFVLTDEADPALVLNLLDIGVDDVFGPPHDFDLVAARVHRAMRARSSAGPPSSRAPGQLSARFDAMSFIDLTQMLANGRKTVRVDLRRDGEEATLFFSAGRPVHAQAGPLLGPPAVYHVVGWEDDGEFDVHEVSACPQPNITESIESLLMEGVRILDESRA